EYRKVREAARAAHDDSLWWFVNMNPITVLFAKRVFLSETDDPDPSTVKVMTMLYRDPRRSPDEIAAALDGPYREAMDLDRSILQHEALLKVPETKQDHLLHAVTITWF